MEPIVEENQRGICCPAHCSSSHASVLQAMGFKYHLFAPPKTNFVPSHMVVVMFHGILKLNCLKLFFDFIWEDVLFYQLPIFLFSSIQTNWLVIQSNFYWFIIFTGHVLYFSSGDIWYRSSCWSVCSWNYDRIHLWAPGWHVCC